MFDPGDAAAVMACMVVEEWVVHSQATESKTEFTVKTESKANRKVPATQETEKTEEEEEDSIRLLGEVAERQAEERQAAAAELLQSLVAEKLEAGPKIVEYEESLETVEDVLICLFLKTSVSRIGVPRVRILEVFREVDKHNRGSIDIEDLNYFLLKCKIRYTRVLSL